jgi:anaerobic selenocysteine-containing dehydrogenase
VLPDFERYNERIVASGGFHLPNAAALRQWLTPSGLAQFQPIPPAAAASAAAYPLQLTTIRSHDQYNTSVYGYDDRYRGVKGRRDVLFMNAADIATLGMRDGDLVDVAADAGGDGAERILPGRTLVEYPIAAGCCAAYYPEASPLIALSAFDPQSHTPSFKSVAVCVRAAAAI